MMINQEKAEQTLIRLFCWFVTTPQNYTIEKQTADIELIAAALAEAEARGAEELARIDAAFARRNALDDCETRVQKAWKACETAARLDRENSQQRAEIERLKAEVERRKGYRPAVAAALAEAEKDLEKERMRLAACGVAAMCNTESSIRDQRIDKDNPYWSASYGAVCDAVDREMDIRTRLAEAERERDEGLQYLQRVFKLAAPQCEPFDKLVLLVSQIDNLIVGLTAERDAVEAKGVRMGLERARELSQPWTKCRCDSAYTDRGRHEPNAPHEVADEIVAAIDAEIAKAATPSGSQ